MVLLTITPSILEELQKLQAKTPTTSKAEAEANEADKTDKTEEADEEPKTTTETTDEPERTDGKDEKAALAPQTTEPDLSNPSLGAPISHSQIIDLWKSLKASEKDGTANGTEESKPPAKTPSLETLLRGSKVYVPPPPPKKEPSPEYKALMARLRRDEEARAYDRMLNPDPYTNMATARLTSSYAQVNRPVSAADMGDDDVTLSDVNRQVMLIFNFLVTMLGVAYALWVLARWWPTPSRLFLALGGSIAVGIAEYGLYAGYVWHLSEAAKKEKTAAPKEVREVVKTWVVEREETSEVSIPGGTGASGIDNTQARRRKKEADL